MGAIAGMYADQNGFSFLFPVFYLASGMGAAGLLIREDE